MVEGLITIRYDITLLIILVWVRLICRIHTSAY